MKTKIQKQKVLKELSDAITVRNHVMDIVNGPRGIASKEHLNKLRAFISEIDQLVIHEVLSFDAPVTAPVPSKKDLDIAQARSNMKLEKDLAMVDAKLEKKTQTDVKPEESKKTSKKTVKKTPKKGVFKRVLD